MSTINDLTKHVPSRSCDDIIVPIDEEFLLEDLVIEPDGQVALLVKEDEQS